MNITQDEILAAIAQHITSLPRTEGVSGITAPEFAKAQGVALTEARAQLGALKAAGVLEQVKVKRQRYDGVWSTQTGFRPK